VLRDKKRANLEEVLQSLDKKMPKKKYIVALNSSERRELEGLVKKGKIAAYKMNHARILLLADINQNNGGWKDAQISESLNISHATIERVRQRFVEEGMKSALNRREQKNRRPKVIDGEKEAYLSYKVGDM